MKIRLGGWQSDVSSGEQQPGKEQQPGDTFNMSGAEDEEDEESWLEKDGLTGFFDKMHI